MTISSISKLVETDCKPNEIAEPTRESISTGLRPTTSDTAGSQKFDRSAANAPTEKTRPTLLSLTPRLDENWTRMGKPMLTPINSVATVIRTRSVAHSLRYLTGSRTGDVKVRLDEARLKKVFGGGFSSSSPSDIAESRKIFASSSSDIAESPIAEVSLMNKRRFDRYPFQGSICHSAARRYRSQEPKALLSRR
mmetsp:Transcript_11543/g.21966  ORF Transcript_11543/g.21966 Transcript_11543/m.21966 type:complete len:194 (+) Transcript_11543:1492-2073(+)